LPAALRKLHVVFENAEAFRQEYDSNLSNGGVFVPTDEVFELRQFVEVRLQFPYVSQSIELEAKIVHVAGVEMAGLGGSAGVALQFRLPVQDLRERLSHIDAASATSENLALEEGPRAAPRKAARVPAQIQFGELTIVGQTRNLSATGALVDVDGSDLIPGSKVTLVLRHPATESQMAIAAEVARQVVTDGEVSAVGLSFAPAAQDQEEVANFVEELQALEHTRRLGGISGPLGDIGAVGALQMFSTTAPKGTLVLRRGQEEGIIAFEGGLLRLARLGTVTGMKAMVRLLQWQDGVFEFQSHIESAEIADAPFPLEAAMLDAVRQIDEGARLDEARGSGARSRPRRLHGAARARDRAGAGSGGVSRDLVPGRSRRARHRLVGPRASPPADRKIMILGDARAR
jgi:Tfp pilus assembly protein PilZ